MSEFYLDANGSDGSEAAQIDRVYPDGTRVPLADAPLVDTPAQQVQAIPNWATWTAAEATAYIDAQVTDIASAKVVLRALARVVVALRDAQWPWLAG